MTAPLVDPFARAISYLRVSVTDRCDFRCVYCMSENMTFLPKADLLTLEELDRLCSTFVRLGVQKLRITGGEPLVRKGILTFFEAMSRHLDTGALKELTLTTNGSQLRKYAAELAGCRRAADQCLARHAGRGEVRPDHPLGPPAAGAGRDRGGARGRAARQDQRGRAEGRERGRAVLPDRLVRARGARPDLDRGHADGRPRQRGPAGPVLDACATCARGWPRATP